MHWLHILCTKSQYSGGSGFHDGKIYAGTNIRSAADKEKLPSNRQSYGKRVAKYYELELILEGSGTIVTDHQRIQTIPERLFIRKPGMHLEGFTPYYSYYIVFSDESGRLADLNLPLYLDGMGQLTVLFKTIRNNFIYPDLASELEIRSCILKIFSAIIRNTSEMASPTAIESIQYIKKHLGEELSVSSLPLLPGTA